MTEQANPGSVEVRLRALFPTLVAEVDHPDPVELNARLVKFIHRIRDEAPPEKRASTIRHGWRSTSDLLDYDVPEIRSLRLFFDNCIRTYVNQWAKSENTPNIPKSFIHQYKGWAVILNEGGYQQQHVHSRTDLVGVYCVARPEPIHPQDDIGGALTLIDPRTGRLSTRVSWETDLQSFPPVPGRLYLLPSFVAHRIEPVTAPGERITINFDVLVQGRSQ